MMQIERLVLYASDGRTREIPFELGALNVITGDSQTGKSTLTNIFRYCLGSRRPDVPVGPISATVAWYGLMLRIGDRRIYTARPAADGTSEVSAAMLLIEPEDIPSLSDLEPNTSASELREYLGAAIGIDENQNVPPPGQTRNALSAGFVHSLYYCFQSQGEVANPATLFHRQNLEWQTQAIRDTLPYFLGAQGAEELRQRRQLTEQRRALRISEQRLTQAEAEQLVGLDRASGLLLEARDAGLLTADDYPDADSLDVSQSRRLLQDLVDRPLAPEATSSAGAEFETTRLRLADLRDRAREIVEQVRGLDSFSDVTTRYSDELGEHRARLISIGLVGDPEHEVACPVCGSDIPENAADEDQATTLAELESVSRRLELADRDRPRVERARADLLEERAAVLLEIQDLNAALASLAETNDLAARERQRVNIQSYVRGKIAEYLGSMTTVDAAEFDGLVLRVQELRSSIAALEESLDPEALRSRVDSAMARINRDVTTLAQSLGLEHSAEGVRVDPHRLTVVADTASGPAYLDAGHIGSGLNWVGYHLAVYLALQGYFIANLRPVPRFILVDQPSQAFFPSDQPAGGDLEELSDSDRAHTKALYRLMYDEVKRHAGALQIIALDHADFGDEWFGNCVVQRWREGDALIPTSWIEAT